MVPHSRACHSGDRQVMALSHPPFMAFLPPSRGSAEGPGG